MRWRSHGWEVMGVVSSPLRLVINIFHFAANHCLNIVTSLISGIEYELSHSLPTFCWEAFTAGSSFIVT